LGLIATSIKITLKLSSRVFCSVLKAKVYILSGIEVRVFFFKFNDSSGKFKLDSNNNDDAKVLVGNIHKFGYKFSSSVKKKRTGHRCNLQYLVPVFFLGSAA